MKARTLVIHPVLNGFIVEVGCQKVVVTSLQKLVEEIGRYYTNPEAVESDYIAAAVNKMDVSPAADPVSANTALRGPLREACDERVEICSGPEAPAPELSNS